MGGLAGSVGGMTTIPSETDQQVLAELRKAVPAAIEEVNGFVTRLAAFYKQLADAGLYPPAPTPVK